MAKAVVISHPSEVVRKGLQSILMEEIRAKVLCTEEISNINEEQYSTYSDIVILFPESEDGKLWLESLRGRSNRFSLISVNLKKTETQNDLIDYSYNIGSPAKELIDKVKTFLSESKENETDDELTIREKEVLRLIALGYTNKTIAESLFISTHTVISHRKNITEKLGIKSIPGLTVYAIIQKIISQSDISNDQLH